MLGAESSALVVCPRVYAEEDMVGVLAVVGPELDTDEDRLRAAVEAPGETLKPVEVAEGESEFEEAVLALVDDMLQVTRNLNGRAS